MRGVLALLILCAVAAANEERVRLDAWDAYVLGEARDPRYAPVLLRELRRYREREGAGAWAVRQAILDALIRSKAKVSAGQILPLARRHSTPVFALLISNAEANLPALTGMLTNQRSDARWAALCNVLARQKAPGLAAHLLGELEVELRFTVADPGEALLIGCGGGAMGGRGCGRMTVPRGWPPSPRYKLTFKKTTGAALLADGPNPVYLERREYPPGTHGRGGRLERVERNDARLCYVALLLDRKHGELGFQSKNSTSIEWVDAAQCEREMRAAQASIERDWKGLKRELVARGLLSPADSRRLCLDLRVSVLDVRKDRRTPLPHVPSGPPAVPQAG